MKRIALLLCIIMGISTGLPVAASNNDIIIILNDETITFDVSPTIENNRVLVPIRGLFEHLGAVVVWNQKSSSITIEDDTRIIKMIIGDDRAEVIDKTNPSAENMIFLLDTPPQIINGRVMVPLRFVAEMLDTTPNWDHSNRTVLITTAKNPPIIEMTKPIYFEEVTRQELEKNKDLYQWFMSNHKDEGTYITTIENYHYILVAGGRKPTGGYSITIQDILYSSSNTIYVRSTLSSPQSDEMVTQAITYPSKLVKINGSYEIKNLDYDIFHLEKDTEQDNTVDYRVLSYHELHNNTQLDQWYHDHYKVEGTYFSMFNDKLYILVAAGERPTGGYTIEINQLVFMEDDSLYIDAKVISPLPDEMVTEAFTHPNLLIEIDGKHINKVEGDISTNTTINFLQ